GKFDLVGLPPAPRGVPQIEVSFDIDNNGILHVSAKDLGTGKSQQIRIESSSGLSEEEIQKMVKDAEANAEKDKAEREKVDVKNQADQLIFQTEKTLSEAGDKISDEDKSKITSALEDLKEKVKGEDIQAIKDSMDALMKSSHKMAEEMYKQAQAQGGAGGAQQGAQAGAGGDQQAEQSSDKDKGDGAVEADFEEVDDK
ncbi:MAG: Hsp70 family protein, partial [Chitinispirillaceae bacterium]